MPEEFGGANLDYVTLALVLEEIATGDGGTSTAISVTNCPVNAILMRYGNAQQKRDWLTPLARGEMLGAFCLTEPHVGSYASALRTTAVKQGDEYVINGVKQFITSGKNGHVDVPYLLVHDFDSHLRLTASRLPYLLTLALLSTLSTVFFVRRQPSETTNNRSLANAIHAGALFIVYLFCLGLVLPTVNQMSGLTTPSHEWLHLGSYVMKMLGL